MRYKATTEQAQPRPPAYSDRSFLHSWVAGAFLPLLQAFITGVMAMVLTAAVIYVFDGHRYFKSMMAAGAIVSVSMWVILQRRWFNLTKLEQIIGADLNGDQVIGEPRKVRVQIDRVTEQGHIEQNQMFDLPCTEEQLRQYADGIINQGKTPAEKEWAGPDKPFSIDGFREFRAEMIRRGLLVVANAKSKQHGFVHTAVGEHLLQRFIEEE